MHEVLTNDQWRIHFLKQFQRHGCNVVSSTVETPVEDISVMKKRSLVILRVSNRESTTANQKLAMEKYLKTLKVQPEIKHITGTSWKKAIPEMKKLMEEIEQGLWKDVTLWRVCRTGRDHEYDVKLWNTCIKHGVTLRYLDDNLSSDNETDRQMFYFRSIMAEQERLLISKRTKEGIARIRQEARSKGQADPFKGKKKGVRWEKTRKAIPMILDLFRCGHSMRQIAKNVHLNERTVMDIRDTPIAKLRDQTGNPKLKDWKR